MRKFYRQTAIGSFLMELAHKKIVVVGLGVTGAALARFLSDRGAAVIATDMASESDLGSRVQAFQVMVEFYRKIQVIYQFSGSLPNLSVAEKHYCSLRFPEGSVFQYQLYIPLSQIG